jgi:hypothetical protein
LPKTPAPIEPVARQTPGPAKDAAPADGTLLFGDDIEIKVPPAK